MGAIRCDGIFFCFHSERLFAGFASILDFIREDLLAHFSFPFWLHIMIGQLTGCSKKRAKADWLMTCAKADWLRTNVVTFFLLSDWLVQNLPLF